MVKRAALSIFAAAFAALVLSEPSTGNARNARYFRSLRRIDIETRHLRCGRYSLILLCISSGVCLREEQAWQAVPTNSGRYGSRR